MSTLSDHQIRRAMVDGRIRIDPYRPSFLNTSSYDVCLGEFFYRESAPKFAGNVFNIYDPEHVKRVWGDAQRAETAALQEVCGVNINPDDRIILLEPGETILAHTEEFIGGRIDVTTMMKARSSMGRSFVTVCKCAGWGDVGYINRWTMEITNVSNKYYIPLIVGERIAQIVFFDAPHAEGDYATDGNYQNTASLEELKANWKPESMLPRTKRTIIE